MFSVSGSSRPAGGAGVAHEPSYAAGLPAATGFFSAVVSLIWQARSAAKRVVEQRGERDVGVLRVADVRAPVGEGQRGGLEVVVQGRLRGHRGQVVALHDVQRLADGRAAGGGRRHAVHVVPAVVDLGRLAVLRLVRREVGDLHGAGRHGQRGRRRLGRALHGAGDVGGQLAAVERLHALLGEQAVGLGEVRVLQLRADRGRRAAGQVDLAGRRERREARGVLGRLQVERLVDEEAAVGQLDRRLQHLAQRPGAPARQRLVPGGGSAGHADGDAARDQLGREVVGLARLRVDERVRGHPGRRGLAAVDRLHLALLRVVEHEVAAAADARAVGLGDAQRRRRRDRGVDGVAAHPQHAQAGAGRRRVDRAHAAAEADAGGCTSGGRWWGAGSAPEAGPEPGTTSAPAAARPRIAIRDVERTRMKALPSRDSPSTQPGMAADVDRPWGCAPGLPWRRAGRRTGRRGGGAHGDRPRRSRRREPARWAPCPRGAGCPGARGRHAVRCAAGGAGVGRPAARDLAGGAARRDRRAALGAADRRPGRPGGGGDRAGRVPARARRDRRRDRGDGPPRPGPGADPGRPSAGGAGPARAARRLARRGRPARRRGRVAPGAPRAGRRTRTPHPRAHRRVRRVAGDRPQAVAAAEQWVAAAPLDERAHRALVAALDAAGDRAGAVRAYEACRTLLAEELGVDPTRETVEVYLHALGDESALSAAPVPQATTSFVGRAEEIAAVAAHLAGPGLVTVAGPAGVGKSRVVAEVVHGLRGAGPSRPVGAAGVGHPGRAGAGHRGPRAGPVAGRRPGRVRGGRAGAVRSARPRPRRLRGGPRRRGHPRRRARHPVPAADPGRHQPRAPRPPGRGGGAAGAVVDARGRRSPGAVPPWTCSPPAPATGAGSVERADRAVLGGLLRHCGGIPLAIELVAAQLTTVAVGDLADLLDDLLHGNDDPVRGVASSSYALLSEEEAAVFRRFAVLDGSVALRVATPVLAGERVTGPRVVRILGQLVGVRPAPRRPHGRALALEPGRRAAPVRPRAARRAGRGDRGARPPRRGRPRDPAGGCPGRAGRVRRPGHRHARLGPVLPRRRRRRPGRRGDRPGAGLPAAPLLGRDERRRGALLARSAARGGRKARSGGRRTRRTPSGTWSTGPATATRRSRACSEPRTCSPASRTSTSPARSSSSRGCSTTPTIPARRSTPSGARSRSPTASARSCGCRR